MYITIISAESLKSLIASGMPHMVFDCSFDLMQPASGEQQYLDSHIPGAVFADLDRVLSAKSGPRASGGRHPLPTRENFAAWLATVGFGNDMQAVVYDRNGSGFCGRLWWMLKWVGHEAVAVLDGGLQAWQAIGAATTGGVEVALARSAFELGQQGRLLRDASDLLAGLGSSSQTIVDARAPARYKGEVEPLDPVAGHIPGALNRPFNLNFDADGKFKPATQLRAEFEQLLDGRDPSTVVHHCGSGVTAIPNVLAMEIAGFGNSMLYGGSWSDWCSDSARPVEKG